MATDPPCPVSTPPAPARRVLQEHRHRPRSPEGPRSRRPLGQTIAVEVAHGEGAGAGSARAVARRRRKVPSPAGLCGGRQVHRVSRRRGCPVPSPIQYPPTHRRLVPAGYPRRQEGPSDPVRGGAPRPCRSGSRRRGPPPRSDQVGRGHRRRFPADAYPVAGPTPRHGALGEHLDRARPPRHDDVELGVAVEVRERQAVGHSTPRASSTGPRSSPDLRPPGTGRPRSGSRSPPPDQRPRRRRAVAVQVSRGHRDGRERGRAATGPEATGMVIPDPRREALTAHASLRSHAAPTRPIRCHGPCDVARPAEVRFTSGREERQEECGDERRNRPSKPRDDRHGVPRHREATPGRPGMMDVMDIAR